MKGETIKEKLSQIGKTQKELAELLGVTPQAIYEILSASDVRSSTIEKIANAVGVPTTFFFEENSLVPNLKRGKVKIHFTNDIGTKVRVLLCQHHKKLSDLCQYVGITEAGMRKVFGRDTCNIDTLIKIAEYFSVPINHFLPQNGVAQDFSKDKEIEYLKGQIKAYENALKSLTSLSDEVKLPKLSVG